MWPQDQYVRSYKKKLPNQILLIRTQERKINKKPKQIKANKIKRFNNIKNAT